MTDDEANDLLQRLGRVIAELSHVPDLIQERDRLICEIVEGMGYGSGAKLARLTGLTRMRIHQIAKG